MTNPNVDFYFEKSQKWQGAIEKLRTIVLGCGLTEELKFGCPCYTFQNGNVVIIHEFKDYCALLFIKGALLNDTEGILIQQTENVQAGRQIRFTDLQQIIELKPTLNAYIFEAIEIEKAGLKVEMKKASEFILSDELQNKLDENEALKTAFEALTPGRQRAYNLYFSEAKQVQTRLSRIDKYTQQILNGKGLNDCTCGLSKKMPQCDGSHKFLIADKNKF
jgi:uncharacterized protein YdeI (YjbR/CyaY-like superfamily)